MFLFVLAFLFLPITLPLYISFAFLRMASRLIFPPPANPSGSLSSYSPTVQDVLEAKKVLFDVNLPVEIVDIILDAAEYWPRTSQVTRFDQTPSGRLMVTGASRDQDQLLLRCCPLTFTTLPGSPSRPGDWLFGSLPRSKLRPLKHEYRSADFHRYAASDNDGTSPCRPGLRRLDHPCRKIAFTIVSHDQGWGGNRSNPNPFGESHTWFEVGLERFECGDSCTDGCKDGSPDPARPLSQSSSSSSWRSQPVSGKEAKAVGENNDADDDALLAKMKSDLSLCHLRPVIPPLTNEQPIPSSSPFLPSTSSSAPEAGETTYTYDFPLHSDERLKIQCNKRAQRLRGTYRIEWRACDDISPDSAAAEDLVARGRGRRTGDGEFVRSLKPGDVVTVWGKARYPGWVNHIDKVQVDIYWAV